MWYKNLHCTKCVIKQRLLSLSRSHCLSVSPSLPCLPCGRWDNPWAWPGRTLRTFRCLFYAARGRSHVCNWCCSWCALCVRVCVCVCACVCVYQFTASLHTVQENQNGSHENQHPAAVAVATQAAASGKCKVNFVEGHASSRTGASLGHQLATLYSASLPAIGTVVFVFTLLCLCVCVLPFCAHCLVWRFISHCV